MRLVVLAGGSPLAYPLPDEGVVLLGRDEACEIVVDDGSVSRRHAAMRVYAGQLTIEDLGSRNGIRVRGERLEKGQTAGLELNELFELGAVVIAVKGPSRPRARSALIAPGASGASSAPVAALSAAMVRANDLADLVAPAPVCVLLLGETGVGKTATAERIHATSGRTGPLVKLNCAAVPEALLEGELFGYERGAFTGAQTAKPGLIEAAADGTLLLDEIGDMPLATQAKLLHVVEHGEVTRLGALKPRKVDVRFLAATHRDLPDMVAKGTFRADLYYRVNGISILIPPLRERSEEVVAIAEHFLAATCARMGKPPPSLGQAARAALLAYAWPGNLREVRNVMDRVALLTRTPEVAAESLDLASLASTGTWPAPATEAPPPAPGGAGPSAAARSGGDLRSELDSFERERIVKALDEAGGNQTRAAQLLNLPLRTFVKRLTHHGLTKPRRS
jgi:transcriptional regulator with PAS, ATPase and Fis domain